MENKGYSGWLPLNTGISLFLVAGLSAFFFTFPARFFLGYNSFNSYFNVIYIPMASFLLFSYAIERRIRPAIVVLTAAFISLAFLSNMAGGKNLFNHLATFFNVALPLLFIGVCLEREMIKPLFTRFLKVMNVMIIFIMVVGICDMLSGGIIQQFLIKHVFDSNMAELADATLATGIYRYYFIFGHPLTLAWYFLLFFTLNVLNNWYNKVLLSTPIAALITLTGLVLCNSRSALLIGLVMILLLNGDKKHRWIYLASVLVLAATVAFVPMIRDSVVQRFVNEIQTSTVSGGRNEAALLVFEGQVDPPGVIVGTGLGGSRTVTVDQIGFINSFEYPLLMFAYDVSITGTAILYIVVLFIPLVIFARKKRWLESGLYFLLFLYLNGFNLIADYTDGMPQLCFIAMLLLHLGREPVRISAPLSPQLTSSTRSTI